MRADERVERCIYQRPTSGRYAVHVRLNMHYESATFDTLEEARVFRAAVEAKRRKRARIKRALPGRDMSYSADATDQRERNRELIRTAKRSKTVIDRRKFTVDHLPPVAGGIT